MVSLACSLPGGGGRACFLYGVKVGVCPGDRPGVGGLGALPTPLMVVCAGGRRRTLLLLLALQKWQLGVWSFCILLSRICPDCACTQLFLVPYSFFVSVAPGDICPGASTAAKGPRSQAPGCLTRSWPCKAYLPPKASPSPVPFSAVSVASSLPPSFQDSQAPWCLF